jgi:pyruvate kinase
MNDATIGSRRHVNLPGVKIRLPGITNKDKEDILFGIKNKYNFIAASFIRKSDNVREIREFLDTHGGKDIRIISKIENAEGIENLQEIIAISDGIMVAR